MTQAALFETQAPRPLAVARVKRLGQYFSGGRVAALLTALANIEAGSRVCDPMAGSGDMLLAALPYEPALVAGIELDPAAHSVCTDRVSDLHPAAVLAAGNAFEVANQLTPPDGFDLVITNPPYVRYQTGSRRDVLDVPIPSATEVRAQLIAQLSTLPSLADVDRADFLEVADEYSGLADLAVPSWILCAALTRPGGTLAMVMPETWLSRDYAAPIRRLMNDAFAVRCVINDASGAWFDSALVRTALVVAKRRSADDRAWAGVPVRHVRLRREAADARSLVGGAYDQAIRPDAVFADDLFAGQLDNAASRAGVEVAAIDATRIAPSARQTRSVESAAYATVKERLPAPLSAFTRSDSLTTLQGYGWRAGQGLRTGANAFFYVDALAFRGTKVDVVSGLLPGQHISVDATLLRPALRRQTELPVGLTVSATAVRGRLLVIDDVVLREDLETAVRCAPTLRDRLSTTYRVMPETLARLIRVAAATPSPGHPEGTLIPGLTAVTPNVRPVNVASPARLPRWWYMLPPLTNRHVPQLLVPRVNGDRVVAYNNADGVVVDANFATLWPTGQGSAAGSAMLAILNSTWVSAVLESTAAVMGGGALKVEATHLAQLPLPMAASDFLERMVKLGRALADVADRRRNSLISEIDRTVARQMAPDAADELTEALSRLAMARRRDRSGR